MSPPPPFIESFSLLREKVPGFERYPFSIPAIKTLQTLELHPQVTFLIGENGSGKSTLLEALAIKCGMNAEGGGRNFNFSTRASHSDLSDYLRLRRSWRRPSDTYFLRAESFFNVATEIEKLQVGQGYGEIPLHEQSHGESFFALLKNRLHGGGLYFFDEPEAALSPQRQLSLLIIINQLVKADSQLIIATHSPIILAYPRATIWQLSATKIECVPYTDTDHFRITHDFLVGHEEMLTRLFNANSKGEE